MAAALAPLSSLTTDFNAMLADELEFEIDADFWWPLVGETEDGFFGDTLSGISAGLGEVLVDIAGDAYKRLMLVDEYDLVCSDVVG